MDDAEKLEMLNELKEARFTGAKRIRHRDRDVIYRTDDEMRRQIADLEKELGLRPARPNVTLARFGSGL